MPNTDAIEATLNWIDNADLADASDIYGYCRKCHGEIAHKDECCVPVARAQLAALVQENERLRQSPAAAEDDTKRLDWLEGEWDREQEAVQHNRETPNSLFRENLPITRYTIDTAMAIGWLAARGGSDAAT